MAWWPFGKKKKEEEEIIEDQNFRVSDDDIDFSLFRKNDEAAPATADAETPAADGFENAAQSAADESFEYSAQTAATENFDNATVYESAAETAEEETAPARYPAP